MISNEGGNDDRVHLTDTELISHDAPPHMQLPDFIDQRRSSNNSGISGGARGSSAITPAGRHASADSHHQIWPVTKSDLLLQGVQGTEKRKSIWKKVQGAVFPIFVMGVILALVIMLFIINSSGSVEPVPVAYTCQATCSVSLVESIPEKLQYPSPSPSHQTTFSVWKKLISQANQTIHIASMYWTLREKDTGPHDFPSSAEGGEIFALLLAAIKRGVKVRIAVNSKNVTAPDLQVLSKAGAEVRPVNFTRLFNEGVLHTKLIISDNSSFYVGSANMDWRSLTQVKEMGTYISGCESCPVYEDLVKIFDIYWQMGTEDSEVPKRWPPAMDTDFNDTQPLEIRVSENETAFMYISSSPKAFCTKSRIVDLDAILRIMDDAEEYIYIAVMDYFPTTLYMPANQNIFWPVIDNKLRQLAFEKKIQVRLLGSKWNHTEPVMLDYLKSLQDFSDNIQTKVFVVPTFPDQVSIPFARVNHNKYMVTDRVAYIGTSNWSGDYFMDTAGVGVVYNQSHIPPTNTSQNIRAQLADVFRRDWESVYTHSVDALTV